MLLGIMCGVVVLNHRQVLMQLRDVHDIIHSPAFCLLQFLTFSRVFAKRTGPGKVA